MTAYIKHPVFLATTLAAAIALVACAGAQDSTAPPKDSDGNPSQANNGGDEPGLVRLSPNHDLWIDNVNKRVVMKGYVCLRNGQLEMLVTLKGKKEHEAVVAVDTKAQFVHAALLALGAEAGGAVRFTPEYKPATGTEIDVEFKYTDTDGKEHTVRGQEWVRNFQTQRVMDYDFVFGGSGFVVDEETKQRRYLAEEGDFICVSNFPSAMCDLPVKSSQGTADLLFECFTERVPPVKTPVTVYLTPRPKQQPQEGKPAKQEAS